MDFLTLSEEKSEIFLKNRKVNRIRENCRCSVRRQWKKLVRVLRGTGTSCLWKKWKQMYPWGTTFFQNLLHHFLVRRCTGLSKLGSKYKSTKLKHRLGQSNSYWNIIRYCWSIDISTKQHMHIYLAFIRIYVNRLTFVLYYARHPRHTLVQSTAM